MKNDSNKNKSRWRAVRNAAAGSILLLAMCGCGSIHGVQGNLTWYQGFGGKFGGSNLNNDMVGVGISFPIGKQ